MSTSERDTIKAKAFWVRWMESRKEEGVGSFQLGFPYPTQDTVAPESLGWRVMPSAWSEGKERSF